MPRSHLRHPISLHGGDDGDMSGEENKESTDDKHRVADEDILPEVLV